MMALYVLQRSLRSKSLDRAVLMGGHVVRILEWLLQQAEAEIPASARDRPVHSNRVPDRAVIECRPVSIYNDRDYGVY